MAKSLVGALALASIPSALAFRNTSPLFLYSTAELLIPGAESDSGIARSDEVTEKINGALKSCPTKTYFVVRQDGVSSDDFLDSRTAPRLAYSLGGKNADVRSTFIVPEIVEDTKISTSIADYLKGQCGSEVVRAEGGNAPEAGANAASRVIEIAFTAPYTQRTAGLGHNDLALDQLIEKTTDLHDYTVIYTTTPPTEEQSKAAIEHQAYEMEESFHGAVQMELKRDLSAHRRAARKEGALFERYQYFSPGIFMAFFAVVPIFSIIFVGLKALTSLEVSYFAFSKEMGPGAQRKQ